MILKQIKSELFKIFNWEEAEKSGLNVNCEGWVTELKLKDKNDFMSMQKVFFLLQSLLVVFREKSLLRNMSTHGQIKVTLGPVYN